MGNSVLMMDAEGLHALANTLEGRAGSFDSLISTFDSNTNSITDASVWSGDDSVAFNGAAKEFKANLDRASQFLHDVARDLETTAGNYDATYESSTARSSSL
jgi:WXG100 family type VII secretion target